MNKFITIFSVLLFVTYVNTTEKVSYSEIVNSLAQITQVQGAPGLVGAISSSFKESQSQLEKFNTAIERQCASIVESGSRRKASTELVIRTLNTNISNLELNNKNLGEQIVQAEKEVVAHNNSKAQVQTSLNQNRQSINTRSMNVVQRARILKRLLNLIEDELTANQRKSTVGSFNVNNQVSKFSFAEIHNELSELESHDPITKSMITTLILISRNPQGNFVNAESVKKIRGLVSGIINKDTANFRLFRQTAKSRSALLKTQRANLDLLINKAQVANTERRSTIASNLNLVKSHRAEIRGLEKVLARNSVRTTSNVEACKRSKQISDMQRRHFKAGVRRFDELARLLA